LLLILNLLSTAIVSVWIIAKRYREVDIYLVSTLTKKEPVLKRSTIIKGVIDELKANLT